MKILNPVATTHHIVIAQLDGAEEMLTASYNPDKEFRPISVLLEWTRVAGMLDGWRLNTCRVSGPVLKQDGTDGKQQTHHSFATIGALDNDAPEWLQKFIKQYAPEEN